MTDWEALLEAYQAAHPTVPVIDDLQRVQLLNDRSTMLTPLDGGITVEVGRRMCACVGYATWRWRCTDGSFVHIAPFFLSASCPQCGDWSAASGAAAHSMRRSKEHLGQPSGMCRLALGRRQGCQRW